MPTPEEIAALPPDGGPEFNRLIFSHSPYLLQHARNPVDWYPWGKEAFERAAKENKPVLLSIGYTTCHWCHVMEHESFEDEEVAALINDNFIAVKVDREERPDIDEVYMTVTQALTGGGGWPMTVFLTPDKDPFFAGTYFPKENRPGRIGFKFLLGKIHESWTDDRDNVVTTATKITDQLGEVMTFQAGGELSDQVLETAFKMFDSTFDEEHGGFGRAPKFPVPPNLMFLLRYHKRTGSERALEMVESTLKAMRLGGVYDQVGLGMHRYSTDQRWLLPHFEKMLYDQALAAMAYTEAYQVTGDDFYARTAREIFTYVLRDMTSPEGGFYSAEDADSEGKEGKFYVWQMEELGQILTDDELEFFQSKFQLTEEGNFLEEATRERTGDNIPHLREPLSDRERRVWEPIRQRLFEYREKRIHPQKDDKILTDWNGLMIAALARAGQALSTPEYVAAAKKAADFVLENLTSGEGRLLKRYRNGQAGLTAHHEDFTFMIWGLLDLYEATFETEYLKKAIEFQEITDRFFWDPDEKGYFMTASDSEKLIVRAKKIYGGAIPGGNPTSVLNLERLHRITGDSKYADRNSELVASFSAQVEPNPMAYPLLLCGLDFQFGPAHEIVLVGESDSPATEEMLSAVRTRYLPNKVLLLKDPDSSAGLEKLAAYTSELKQLDGQATAYVCREFTCQLPTVEIDRMIKNLGEE